MKKMLIKQKLVGIGCLVASAIYLLLGEEDITPVVAMAPLGIYLVFTKTIIFE